MNGSVTYIGFLWAAEITGDKKYSTYVRKTVFSISLHNEFPSEKIKTSGGLQKRQLPTLETAIIFMRWMMPVLFVRTMIKDHHARTE